MRWTSAGTAASASCGPSWCGACLSRPATTPSRATRRTGASGSSGWDRSPRTRSRASSRPTSGSRTALPAVESRRQTVAGVLDVDETLIDTVCARLRDHLSGDDATRAEAFARQYYRWVAPEDISERRETDLCGAALSHFDLARVRAPGTTKM